MNSRPTPFFLLSASVAFISGCFASLGPVATTTLGSSRSSQVGASGAVHFEVPRTYRLVVGGQADVLGQVSPGSYTDQWRAALGLGYQDWPVPYRSRVGLEVFGRVGYVRGAIADAPPGPGAVLAGATFDVPIRLGPTREPWTADEVISATLILLPSIGYNALFPVGRSSPDSLVNELAFSVRIGLWTSSSLVP